MCKCYYQLSIYSFPIAANWVDSSSSDPLFRSELINLWLLTTLKKHSLQLPVPNPGWSFLCLSKKGLQEAKSEEFWFTNDINPLALKALLILHPNPSSQLQRVCLSVPLVSLSSLSSIWADAWMLPDYLRSTRR